MSQGEIIKIKGTDSEWYHEATFVIKKEITKSHIREGLAEEAEKIISNYAKKNGLPLNKGNDINQRLNFILVAAICILIICLILLY